MQNTKEIQKRVLKYVVMWLALVISGKVFLANKLNNQETITIAIIGAIVFAILDMYCPSINKNI